MYRVDTHVHTSEVSPCGRLSADETVEGYLKAGYHAICISDHFNRGILKHYEGDWRQRVERWLQGYRAAKAAGDRQGLNVLLAAEVKLDEARPDSQNEYLLYGLTEGFLLEQEELFALPFRDFVGRAHQNGVLVVQAHPFRPNMTIDEPSMLDGVEAFNGNPRHNSRNGEALAFAYDHRLRPLSGSDCHQAEDLGRGGILVEKPVVTSRQLRDLIAANEYRLLPEGFEQAAAGE